MKDEIIESEENLEKCVPENNENNISIVRTPIFNKIYATNLSVTKTDSDFRVELFNEKFETEDKPIYHSDGLVIMTAQAAKKLLLSLTEVMGEHEEENGEIIVSEKRMSCK